ncbi:unnamed protein product [Prorocentrum cordatum]|uniref:Uncharacterized protein n=1 Tax=Prorocentrum cordatum TaxID=2364126 RepID=A0ABN9U9V6_9DINO|nr:unnamed protein product [Polarella glacialis]
MARGASFASGAAAVLAERALRYVAVGLPLLLLVFRPAWRPEAASRTFPLVFFLTLSIRVDSPMLGGRLDQALAVVFPALTLTPIFVTLTALLAAFGGPWASWVGVCMLNYTLVCMPMHAYGSSVLKGVALWTNILSADWSFGGALDAGLEAQRASVRPLAVLRTIWLPWLEDGAVPVGVPASWWSEHGTPGNSLFIRWAELMFAALLFCIALAIPPARTGRKQLYASLRLQLERAAGFRQEANEHLESARKKWLWEGAVPFPLPGSAPRGLLLLGRGADAGAACLESLPDSAAAAVPSSGSPCRRSSGDSDDESDDIASTPPAAPLASEPARADVEAEVRASSLADQCAVALAAAAVEPRALPGGAAARAAWAQLQVALAGLVAEARGARRDSAAIAEGRGAEELPHLSVIQTWSAEAAEAAESLHTSVAAILAKLERRAPPEELKRAADAVRFEAAQVLDLGLATAVSAAELNCLISFANFTARETAFTAAHIGGVFARDASFLRMVQAFVIVPARAAQAAAAVAEAQAAAETWPRCCFVGVAVWGVLEPPAAHTGKLASEFWKGMRAGCRGLISACSSKALSPIHWSQQRRHALKWLVGCNLLWLPLLISAPCRHFLSEGNSEFAALALLSYATVFVGTTDGALRKTALRLFGASAACLLSYLGYVLLSWPGILGRVWQPVVFSLYLVMLTLLAILIGMRSTPYSGGWHTWAYMCQKFTYTFASAFLGAYSAEHDRAESIAKAGHSAVAIALGVWAGALWGCFVHLAIWRTSSHGLAMDSLRAAAASAAAALACAARALGSDVSGGDGVGADSLASDSSGDAAAHAAASAAAAKAHVSSASAYHKVAVEFGGKFLGPRGSHGDYAHRVHQLCRARRLAAAAADAAAWLRGGTSSAEAGLQRLFAAEVDPARAFSAGAGATAAARASSEGSAREREREAEPAAAYTCALPVPLLQHAFFAGPPSPGDTEVSQAEAVGESLRATSAVLQEASARRADGGGGASAKLGAALAELRRCYAELRYLRVSRAVDARAGTVRYPVGVALRFHALCQLLCDVQWELQHFWGPEARLGRGKDEPGFSSSSSTSSSDSETGSSSDSPKCNLV